ncbi:MAG: hypothetical protein PF518_02975 [Spirochaetaceae bacterium]|jgi:transglutaminase-like putative cysteine protease|nr:hypothetical protein [Spirochaetaceae bacterium]
MKLNRKRVINISIISLLVIMSSVMILKVSKFNYTFDSIIPRTGYQVHTWMTFTGNKEDLLVKTFLPINGKRQSISNEQINAPDMEFRRHNTTLHSYGEWIRYKAKGPLRIDVYYDVKISPIVYEIDPELTIDQNIDESLNEYLGETDVIQVNDPYIKALASDLVGDDIYLLGILTKFYNYVYALGSRPFKGTTDAITAAKLGEASCNGKSRLFISLTRQLGIPSRLVGGLILNNGSKKTSHQWIEVNIAGHWVPFDTLNGHFAELPDNYLSLYKGDEALFKHSSNIAFDYRFDISRKTVKNDRLNSYLGERSFNIFNILSAFFNINISFNILQFLLVIPLGVLVVTIFRNIIGLNTFGTFLPALMAMSMQNTGLGPGLVVFSLVILLTALLRSPLDKLGLLHTPKMAIMMIIVIFSLLGISLLSNLPFLEFIPSLNSTALFPIAILTITSERVSLTLDEEGLKTTSLIMLQTLIVTAFSYIVISSIAIKAIMISFPELLLAVIAINLWLGSWTGIRIVELIRFRSLYLERLK